MHVFYTPDIQKSNELPEEEAQHCIRVLRLSMETKSRLPTVRVTSTKLKLLLQPTNVVS